MITASEAIDSIVQSSKELPKERVALVNSHGRVLADDIFSDDDIPSFDNSSMDGYAVRAMDTASASDIIPVVLKVIGEHFAGSESLAVVEPMSCVRTMTGAPIPRNSDAVIQHEYVEERNGTIILRRPVEAKTNLRPKGEDVRKGEKVFSKGCRIMSAELGVLASLGCATVGVFAKPQVAILTTGNELLHVSEKAHGNKIRNSNAYSLAGLVHENGGTAIDLGVARDDPRELVEKIQDGLKCDVLITSGGVSAGKHDFVLEALKTVGVELKFWKVNIKPGMPLAFGISDRSGKRTHVFCLPGNPVSTMVTFLQFVKPCIRTMMAMSRESESLRLRAFLMHPIEKKDGKRHYQRGIVEQKNGKLQVQSTGNQSSAALSSMAKANCLIILPEEQSLFNSGEEVDIELV
jgi:molybdopterin molybdotransferase